MILALTPALSQRERGPLWECLEAEKRVRYPPDLADRNPLSPLGEGGGEGERYRQQRTHPYASGALKRIEVRSRRLGLARLPDRTCW